jgi:hypothetical protein
VIKLIRAFILGMIEFRRPFATKIDTFSELEAYELGALGMHRLTLGVFK